MFAVAEWLVIGSLIAAGCGASAAYDRVFRASDAGLPFASLPYPDADADAPCIDASGRFTGR